jgi:16S rRNA (cytosine1402-N4)-methyltransferase
MEFKHRPVMYQETLRALMIRPNGIYVDGTMGGAGHGEGICQGLDSQGWYIGIDRDQAAIHAGTQRLQSYPCKKSFIQANYNELPQVLDQLGVGDIQGGLLDLGVSSFQLDNPHRGFSYMQDASLDMRMDERDVHTAYAVVNEYSEKELSRILKEYGEERWAARIASFIIRERKKAPISTTFQLVEVIKQAIPAGARREGPHPAKRSFQAIRIEVNQELALLEGALDQFLNRLSPGGRMAVITFHSLEDRIVKETFHRRMNPCTCPKEFPICICGKVADIKKITGKPVTPSHEELEENPRSRSAKLRVVEKTGEQT